MQPTSASGGNARGTRQSILAYLAGQQNLAWILSVIDASGEWEAARRLVEDLQGYGDSQRRDALLARLSDAA